MTRVIQFLLLLSVLLFFTSGVDGVTPEEFDLILSKKADVCYYWRYGHWPTWLSQCQLPSREAFKKVFFTVKGSRLKHEQIEKLCKKYLFTILKPTRNVLDSEFCWYAKYGFWKTNPPCPEKEETLGEMVNIYLHRNGSQASQEIVKRICPNYLSMSCEECGNLTEIMCHYARNGRWKKNIPSVTKARNFFYLGQKKISGVEIRRKCPKLKEPYCNIHYPHCPIPLSPSTTTLTPTNTTDPLTTTKPQTSVTNQQTTIPPRCLTTATPTGTKCRSNHGHVPTCVGKTSKKPCNHKPLRYPPRDRLSEFLKYYNQLYQQSFDYNYNNNNPQSLTPSQKRILFLKRYYSK